MEDSVLFPIFALRADIALGEIPNNPKPRCEGFYLTWKTDDGLTTERVGYVPIENQSKYFSLSRKKVLDMRSFGVNRSKDCANPEFQRYQGGIIFCEKPAGVSAHIPEIDEAFALLWLICQKTARTEDPKTAIFWEDFVSLAEIEGNSISDNPWISVIANLMANAN